MAGDWGSVGKESDDIGVAAAMRETTSGWASVGLCEITGERSSDVIMGGEVRSGIIGLRNWEGKYVNQPEGRNRNTYPLLGEGENAFASS
jgi:hypothetical protein